jgi:hypothetical protein
MRSPLECVPLKQIALTGEFAMEARLKQFSDVSA